VITRRHSPELFAPGGVRHVLRQSVEDVVLDDALPQRFAVVVGLELEAVGRFAALVIKTDTKFVAKLFASESAASRLCRR